MVLDPNRQLPDGITDANEAFFDAMIRHQIGLLRVSGSIRNEIHQLLDATETDIRNEIRNRIRRGQGLASSADLRRLDRLLAAIRATRAKAWEDIDALWVERLVEVATNEPEFVAGAARTVAPVNLNLLLPSPELLRSIVTSRPFEGRVLREWSRDMQRADIQRIESQIRIGLTQGESSQAIARRVVGSVSQRGTDGVTQITRRQAEAVTRTAVNAISNQAKREFYKANDDIFSREQYVATLDARTTRICSSLDGNTYAVGEGPIPPLHFNCRSVRVAVFDGTVLGDRPADPTTQRMLLREFTDSRNIPNVTRRADLPRGTKGRFDRFARTRTRQLVGTTPNKVTYEQWLNRQPQMFQNDVLGETRAKLFRDGRLSLDRFVNRQGDEIPLRELARREADAFRAAGLNPDNFT